MKPIPFDSEISEYTNFLSNKPHSSSISLPYAHKPFTLEAPRASNSRSFVDRIKTGIENNIDQCIHSFYPSSTSPSIFSWKSQLEKAAKTASEKTKRLDSTSQIDINMELILLFLKTSEHILQGMYCCDNIEVVFEKRSIVLNIHQLLEKCNQEMNEYMSVLESVKLGSDPNSTTNSKIPMFSSSKIHKPWSKISNNKLAKVADTISQAIPAMMELYLLSNNILKRLDLAGEWHELYAGIIGELERETKQQYDEVQLIKKQISLSGLSASSFMRSLGTSRSSPVLEMFEISYPTCQDITSLEFLQQSLSDTPDGDIKTLPYLNGAQKIVVSKCYTVLTNLKLLEISVKCIPKRIALFEDKAINVYPRAVVKLARRFNTLLEAVYKISKDCHDATETFCSKSFWDQIFVGLCAKANYLSKEYRKLGSSLQNEKISLGSDEKNLEKRHTTLSLLKKVMNLLKLIKQNKLVTDSGILSQVISIEAGLNFIENPSQGLYLIPFKIQKARTNSGSIGKRLSKHSDLITKLSCSLPKSLKSRLSSRCFISVADLNEHPQPKCASLVTLSEKLTPETETKSIDQIGVSSGTLDNLSTEKSFSLKKKESQANKTTLFINSPHIDPQVSDIKSHTNDSSQPFGKLLPGEKSEPFILKETTPVTPTVNRNGPSTPSSSLSKLFQSPTPEHKDWTKFDIDNLDNSNCLDKELFINRNSRSYYEQVLSDDLISSTDSLPLPHYPRNRYSSRGAKRDNSAEETELSSMDSYVEISENSKSSTDNESSFDLEKGTSSFEVVEKPNRFSFKALKSFDLTKALSNTTKSEPTTVTSLSKTPTRSTPMASDKPMFSINSDLFTLEPGFVENSKQRMSSIFSKKRKGSVAHSQSCDPKPVLPSFDFEDQTEPPSVDKSCTPLGSPFKHITATSSLNTQNNTPESSQNTQKYCVHILKKYKIADTQNKVDDKSADQPNNGEQSKHSDLVSRFPSATSRSRRRILRVGTVRRYGGDLKSKKQSDADFDMNNGNGQSKMDKNKKLFIGQDDSDFFESKDDFLIKPFGPMDSLITEKSVSSDSNKPTESLVNESTINPDVTIPGSPKEIFSPDTKTPSNIVYTKSQTTTPLSNIFSPPNPENYSITPLTLIPNDADFQKPVPDSNTKSESSDAFYSELEALATVSPDISKFKFTVDKDHCHSQPSLTNSSIPRKINNQVFSLLSETHSERGSNSVVQKHTSGLDIKNKGHLTLGSRWDESRKEAQTNTGSEIDEASTGAFSTNRNYRLRLSNLTIHNDSKPESLGPLKNSDNEEKGEYVDYNNEFEEESTDQQGIAIKELFISDLCDSSEYGLIPADFQYDLDYQPNVSNDQNLKDLEPFDRIGQTLSTFPSIKCLTEQHLTDNSNPTTQGHDNDIFDQSGSYFKGSTTDCPSNTVSFGLSTSSSKSVLVPVEINISRNQSHVSNISTASDHFSSSSISGSFSSPTRLRVVGPLHSLEQDSSNKGLVETVNYSAQNSENRFFETVPQTIQKALQSTNDRDSVISLSRANSISSSKLFRVKSPRKSLPTSQGLSKLSV